MEFSTLRQALRQACEFPVDQPTLIEIVGDVQIESPTGESVRVETLLRRTDESTYRSVHGVETSVAGTLDGSFVGRPQYDDRAHNPTRSSDLSF